MKNLPKEWYEASVGEIAHNANNLRKPISLSKRAEIKGQYPYYGATGQIDSLNDYTHEGEYILIGEDGANLLSKSKPLSFIADGKYWVNNHAHSLRALAGMPSKFLCLYINSLSLAPWVTGSAQPKLTRGSLDSIPCPLPPLAEQKVIADKLDSLLAQVETTKARLDRIPETLKRFRQSVLAAAVSGRLTEEWRGGESNYVNLNLNLSKSSISFAVVDNWNVQKLSDSCQVVSGNAFKSKDFISTGIPVIKISNVQYGKFEEKNQQYLPFSYLEEFRPFRVDEGDVLMALTRPITNNTLKICRYPKFKQVGLLNQRVAKFIFKDDSEKNFFELLFQSEYFKAQVFDNLSETLQPNLSPVSLKAFKVAIPCVKEQTEIVRRVEELFAYADTVEQKAQAASERVNNLTQSILAKAFRGDLTKDWRAANPDLISGENSAEALLEKIKAEREALKPKKKQGKQKA